MPTNSTTANLQSLTFDDFMYFFLRLRKSRIRAVVRTVRDRFPGETRQQLARRLVASQAPLAFLGGSLLHLPGVLPGVGRGLQLLGFVMGASALTRMHLYLILEIALAYDLDIDDQARVPEMMAVVAATGAAVAVPTVVKALGFDPLVSIPLAGLTAATTTQLIGDVAIRFYEKSLAAAAPGMATQTGI
jgi:hypothetical protein